MSRRFGTTGSTGREIAALVAEWEQGQLSRRSVLRRAAALGLTVPALAVLAGKAGTGRTQAAVLSLAQEDPASGTPGGTLRVATVGEAPNLDEHQSTAGLVAELGYCAYEGLFTYDADYQAIPELVAEHTISEDGLIHTMRLRQGVMFHNGQEMTTADVLASVQRWGRISGVGRRLIEKTSEIAELDEYTLEWRLTEPYGTILIALAHNTQACTIHPKSIMDGGDEPITDPAKYIGTGPYRLVEWQRDAVMRFERFEGYQSSSETVLGYGGKKFAYVDTIEFVPVPDAAARVAGLQAGDYHYAMEVGNDQYEVLNGYPGVVAEILTPTNWDVFFLNWEAPMFKDNLAMRQAVQASLNHEPMLQNGRGGGDFIRLDPGLMMQQTPWWSEAGVEHYNVNNPDLARQKLEEAGYDGTALRFMTTQEYPYMYGEAIVAAQQLEEAGFTVDLQVIDWATVLERRAIPEEWDMFGTGHGFVPDPSQISYVGQMNQYPGWWSSESSLALAADLLAGSAFEERKAVFDQIQEAHYTEIPAIKIGDSSNCSFRSESLKGWDGQFERGYKYWNFWIEE